MNQTSRQEGGHICEPEVSFFFSTAFTTQFYQKKLLSVLDQVMEFLDAK